MKIRDKRAIENYMLEAARFGSKSKAKSFYPMIPELTRISGISDDDAVFDTGVNYKDLDRPLDIGIGMNHPEDDSFDSPIQIQRWRSAKPSDLRGLPIFGKIAFSMDFFAFDNKLNWLKSKGYRIYWISNDGFNFRSCSQSGVVHPVEKGKENRPCMAIQYQTYSDIMWKVSFRFEKGAPALNIMVEPEMAKMALGLRDIPKDKNRRDAAIHFVTSHKRDKPKGGQADIPKHLRGASFHLWQGCEMQVLPPYYDVDRLKPLPKVLETKKELLAL